MLVKILMKLIKKILKYFSYLLLFVVTILVVIIIFISPITEWLIEKYDKKYTGREINIGDLQLNPFKGTLAIYNLTLFEANDKDKFFTCSELSTKVNIFQAIKQKYNVEYFNLKTPYVVIKQTGSKFNFDDLLKLGEGDTTKPEPKTNEKEEPVLWFLNKIKLSNGLINYNDRLVGSKIGISKLNVFVPYFAHDTKDLKVLTDFLINNSGTVKSQLDLNINTLDYKLVTDISNLNIHPFYVYLKEILLAKQFKGTLSTNFKAKGSFADSQDLALKGKIGLQNFLLTDVLDDDLSSFKNLSISIDSINLKKEIFNLNTISLVDSYIKVELYENGNNFNRLMKNSDAPATTTNTAVSATTNSTTVDNKSDSATVTKSSGASSTNIFMIIADYVKMVAKDYILNSYSADKVEITGTEVDYNDFTLGEQFSVNLDSLDIISNRISSENERISAMVKTNINKKGKLAIDMSANPKDFLELDFKTDLKKLPITIFNPYVKYYLAHTFKKGDVNLLISTSINAQHYLKAENNLLIEKIKCGKKIKGVKTAAKVPLKLGVALLRDPKGNIDFKFPVEGNLKDPKYKVGKIILKVFENLLLKAVTAPFNAVGALFSKKEPATDFEFDYLQVDFSKKEQRKVLEKTAEFVNEKPEMQIVFTQNLNPEKEIELLSYKLAKVKYLKNPTYVSPKKEDELKNIDKLDNKDSLFVFYVSNQFKELDSKTSHLDKCKRFVGIDVIKKEHEVIIAQREADIKRILIENKVQEKQIKFTRNIDKKLNLNEVRPSFSFEMDAED